MTIDVALMVISGLLMVVQGLLAYMWHQRGAEISTLRAAVADLLRIVTSSEQAVIAEKVRALESDYFLLHEHKNIRLPLLFAQQYENITGLVGRIEAEINRRLDWLERKVLNGSK